MNPLCLFLSVALVVLCGCSSLDDDRGTAEPATWWPWVCGDGGVAPDAGCPPAPTCPDGGAADADTQDGC